MKYMTIAGILAVYTSAYAPHGFAQPELPFLGTWKPDTTEMKRQLEDANAPEDVIKQKLAILEQQRWVFGIDGKATTITNGLPNSRTWKLAKSEGPPFEIEFLRGQSTESATVTMKGPKRMVLGFPMEDSPTFEMRFLWVSNEQRVVHPRKLEIGSKAPEINLHHQFSEHAKFSGRFEPDHIYFVKFWGTWCAPCVKAMPDLARLQKKFRDKNIHIIAVSNETREAVTEFLATPLPKEMKTLDAQTFGDLTRDLAIAADPDGTTVRDYMAATGQMGIPVAFIIGKTGKLEWIGSGTNQPVSSILRQVSDGDWDRQEFAKVFSKRSKNLKNGENPPAESDRTAP